MEFQSADVRFFQDLRGRRTEITVKCGRSGWGVKPYRATVTMTVTPPSEEENPPQTVAFDCQDDLTKWLDGFIAEMLKSNCQITHYKINGLPVGWLCSVGLPEPKTETEKICPWFRSESCVDRGKQGA